MEEVAPSAADAVVKIARLAGLQESVFVEICLAISKNKEPSMLCFTLFRIISGLYIWSYVHAWFNLLCSANLCIL